MKRPSFVVQKTVLERKKQPTFDVLIEIRQQDVFAIYEDVSKAVDRYLHHELLEPQIRSREMNDEADPSSDLLKKQH